MKGKKAVLVFGGTFDPPTLAHEQIIDSCLDITDFDEVWVMPSGGRTDKPDMTAARARLEMLKIVRVHSFGNDPRLVVTDFEINLPQPTNTAHTVRMLEESYPDTDFWYVFGADSYRTMHNWEEGERLKRSLKLLLIPRFNEPLPPAGGNIRHLPQPKVKISSTDVRGAVQNEKPFEQLVSPGVARFIAGRRFYKARLQ